MARTSGRKGRPWRRAVEIVKARSQICAWCGEAIDLDLPPQDPMSFSVDHIIPLKDLAENDPRRTDPKNLQSMHRKCNMKKGAKTMEEAVEKKRPLRMSRKWIG